MAGANAWLSLEGVNTHPDEFYRLWFLATVTYGVGDTVTTVALVYYAPRIAEGNPLVAAAMGGLGLGGLIAVKWLAFAACIGISLLAIVEWDERQLYLLPPLTLTVVGVLVTGSNLWLLAQ
ncbi:MAG: hypothetical protein ABEJ76_05835 [Halanaeroarchaeum sp.]